jgi:uncharacterized RDD family membrane protein YckC
VRRAVNLEPERGDLMSDHHTNQYVSQEGRPAEWPTIEPGPWAQSSPYAEWGDRAAATLIDVLLLFGGFVIVGMPLVAISDSLGTLVGLLFIAGVLYFQFLNGSRGQSPGKALTGLRVVRDGSDDPIGGGTGVVRYVAAAAISFITCGVSGSSTTCSRFGTRRNKRCMTRSCSRSS